MKMSGCDGSLRHPISIFRDRSRDASFIIALHSLPFTMLKELQSIDHVFFDCDGVLWRGSEAIPGATEALRRLRQAGKQLYFITNNSMHTRSALCARMALLGLTVNEDEILSSSYLTACFLRDRVPPASLIYCVGSEALLSELAAVGFNVLGGPQDDNIQLRPLEHTVPLCDRAAAVVVGFDANFNYAKLAKAQHYLSLLDCLFVATNNDPPFPARDSGILPGCGCFVAAVETASGRKAQIISKPSPFAFTLVRALHPEIEPCRCLMVGDRLETDIAFGRACGMQTLLVETGIHTASDLPNFPDHLHPDFVADSVRILLDSD